LEIGNAELLRWEGVFSIGTFTRREIEFERRNGVRDEKHHLDDLTEFGDGKQSLNNRKEFGRQRQRLTGGSCFGSNKTEFPLVQEYPQPHRGCEYSCCKYFAAER